MSSNVLLAKIVTAAAKFAVSLGPSTDFLRTRALNLGARAYPHPDGWIGFWKPSIGDPSIMGWVTVVAYLVTTWYCFRLVRDRRIRWRHHEAQLWWILAFGLLFLGINKQLDLQSAFTEAGRMLARGHGWYDQRSIVQMVFLFLLFVLGMMSMVAVIRLTRKAPRSTQAAALGAVLLMGFVVMRAASFHYVDRTLREEFSGMRINWIFEIGGILIILAAARRRYSERNRAQRRIMNHPENQK